MRLPFLNRSDELGRIGRAIRRPETSLVVIYGRRRLGKSRLLQEALRGQPSVYYVGDERSPPLQRESLARQIAVLLPGFADVSYGDWSSLLERWWRDSPPGAVLALDELPALVARSPELPSVLQKLIDRVEGPPRHLIVSGSSQRMMHGLALGSASPLYGRARELMRLGPLSLGWLGRAIDVEDPASLVEHWAVWGGVPRYWELAREYSDRAEAVRELILDPLGVLHREPERLLLDDMDDIAGGASLLALVGRGVHRVSEMGNRLGVPATSLSRPLARLLDLGLLIREVPFGRSLRDTKRTRYEIADPLMRFWFRFVEPNRSRLAAGQISQVEKEVAVAWPDHVGRAWEELARASAARIDFDGKRFGPGQRWWGRGTDGGDLEIDLIARADDDPEMLLVGEAKRTCPQRQARGILLELEAKARRCPALVGHRWQCALWVLRGKPRLPGATIVGADAVVASSFAR